MKDDFVSFDLLDLNLQPEMGWDLSVLSDLPNGILTVSHGDGAGKD